MASTDTAALSPPPSSLEVCLFFGRIGLTSFGGGVSGWLLREICHNKKWLPEAEFLDAFGVCQALPGINALNIAIWMGYRLNGTLGAVAGFIGVTVPPGIVLGLFSMIATTLLRFPLTHILLTGLAAAAIGFALSLCVAATRRLPRQVPQIAIAGGVFAAIAFLHWPLLWVVLAGAVLGVANAFREARMKAA